MIYVRSLLAGFAAAVLTLVLLVAATILISMREINSQISGIGAAAGSVTFNSAWMSEVPLFIAVVVAFVLGFIWDLRRSKRKLSPRV